MIEFEMFNEKRNTEEKTKMTAIELIEEAAKVGEWSFDRYKMIRCAKGWCPILAVADSRGFEFNSNWSFNEAGKKLGLSDKDIQDIVRAADFIEGSYTYTSALELRKEMERKLLGKEIQ